MKIDSGITTFLEGKKFTNALTLTISEKNGNTDRLSYIESKCIDKRVIHIGFADHLPLIDKKIKSNNWLHARLLKVTSKCIGVDVDKEAFEYIHKNYSYPDLYLHDVIRDAPLDTITSQQWDYMVLGEILEHINDPVLFLNQLISKYGKYVKKIIITVPNALDLTNIRHAKNHKEYINSDHRYWFTPYTLAKVGTMAGWHPEEFEFCQTHPAPTWYYRRLLKKYPAFRETLVMIFQS